MSEGERLSVLRRVRELSSLDDKTLHSILPFFDEVEVPAGQLVAREGMLCHEYLVIAKGQLEVCRRGQATRLDSGQSFGWEEMQRRARNDATVITMSAAHLLVMSHAQFRAVQAA